MVQQDNYGVRGSERRESPFALLRLFLRNQCQSSRSLNREHQRNLGSSAQAQLTIPVFNWVPRVARFARLASGSSRRNWISASRNANWSTANLFYLEAQTADSQLQALRRSLDLSAESLRLTMLRDQAGEATALEVTDAQMTLSEARNAYADGLARYRVALANLQTLTGVF